MFLISNFRNSNFLFSLRQIEKQNLTLITLNVVVRWRRWKGKQSKRFPVDWISCEAEGRVSYTGNHYLWYFRNHSASFWRFLFINFHLILIQLGTEEGGLWVDFGIYNVHTNFDGICIRYHIQIRTIGCLVTS